MVRRWAWRAGLGAMAVALLGSVAAVGGVAQAATVGSGYVWANDPYATSYTPVPGYQYNTSGGTNTVSRGGPGVYTVSMPGLGTSSGTVLVTAYGPDTTYCKVGRWYTNYPSTTLKIDVLCFSVTGTPADSMYTVSFTNRVGAVHAYLWADQATAPARYEPNAAYQANYTGAKNTVQRYDVGRYGVRIPVDFTGYFGAALVTAYGTGNQRCDTLPAGWDARPSPTMIWSVICRNPDGSPADSQFTLTYVSGGNVLGQPSGAGFSALVVGGRLRVSSEERDNDNEWYNSANGHMTVTRLGTGRYAVNSPVDLSDGDVQVSLDHDWTDGLQCKVSNWNPTDGIVVICFDKTGALTDGGSATYSDQFHVSFVGRL